MGDWKACRCDRCGKVDVDKEKSDRIISRWSCVRIQRREPFYDTGYKDLCGECTDLLVSFMENSESKRADREVAEFVCTAELCKGLSMRVRAAGLALSYDPPKCAYCLKPMERVAPREITASRHAYHNGEVSKLPCDVCGVNHRLGEYERGSVLRTKAEKTCLDAAMNVRLPIKVGTSVVVCEWSQYGSPIYYRCEVVGNSERRANYAPCQLEPVTP